MSSERKGLSYQLQRVTQAVYLRLFGWNPATLRTDLRDEFIRQNRTLRNQIEQLKRLVTWASSGEKHP